MPKHDLPSSFVSVADVVEGAKLSAPSALRNRADVAATLAARAPALGRALEIASGTGEHAVVFAAAMPDLIWHPSEIDPARRASIDAYAADAGHANLRAAVHIDATTAGWAADHNEYDLLHLGNLLHLITWGEAQVLLSEGAQALTTGGVLSLYGPFKRDGVLVSDGDISFDQRLRDQNPDIGYKNDAEVFAYCQTLGLTLREVVEMPANNLALFFDRA